MDNNITTNKQFAVEMAKSAFSGFIKGAMQGTVIGLSTLGLVSLFGIALASLSDCNCDTCIPNSK